MITEKSDKTIVSMGIQSESFFNVKQENLAHIFSILRNQLYSDKILAVVREYCTNAMDANIDAGVPDCPIQVSIPNAFSPFFKVRDFGKGLSEEQVYNIFGSYGESTKRNTNEQTGCLGLGSKSAFSYVDSFTFTSFHAGVKTVYSAYIDETEIGKITRLSVEPSDEPSGIEVLVNVKRGDFGLFHDRSFEVLRYFNPKPIIHNDNDLQSRIDNHDSTPILTGDNWSIVKNPDNRYYNGSSTRTMVVMGNVMYPVNLDNLGLGHVMISYMRSFSHMDIIFKAPIGAVKNSASRESLEYNQKTKSWLFDALANFKEQVGAVLSEQMNTASTMWDAMLMFNDLSTKVGRDNRLQYRGQNVNGYISTSSVRCRKVEKNRNDNLQWNKTKSINPHDNTIIFVDKGNFSRRELFGRIKTFGDMRLHQYLIEFDNPTDADAFLSRPEMEGSPCVDLATVNYVKPLRGASISKSEFSEAYEYSGCSTSRNSLCWNPCQIDMKNGEGIYVVISHFTPIESKLTLSDIFRFKSLLRMNGIDQPIYGVRAKTALTLGSGWKQYQQYQQELFKELTDKLDLENFWDTRTASIPSILNCFQTSLYYSDFTMPDCIQEVLEIMSSVHRENRTKEANLAHHLFEIFVEKYESKLNPKINAVMEKYPMLKLVSWTHSEPDAKVVMDYINMVG